MSKVRPETQPHLEAFRNRLEAFERDLTDGSVPRDELAQALHDLQIAVEEVEVADEEMALQNEELLASHLALAAERQRYRDLFELAPDGYLITNLAGTILEANRAAVRLLNASPRALHRKPLAVFIAPSDRPRFRTLFDRLTAGERLGGWEMTLQPRHRSPLPVLFTAAREAAAAGQPADLLWMVRDISEVKATADALRESEERLRHAQRMEAVGRLAGGIAHSFNNLLAAIAFHIDFLAEGLGEGAASAPLRAHAEEVRKAGERAAALASQLLAFGRKQMLQPRVIAVNEVIARMQPMLVQLIGEDVALTARLDPQAGAVNVDLTQLEQVLLNLLVNARDAMPDGGACTIETRPVEIREGKQPEPGPGVDLPPGSYLLMVVSDTGMGMDGEVKAHLFEPFFTTKEREKGTGLGLATVYGILRQSGGDIRVESAPGKGARFEVYLPRVAAAAEPLEPRPRPRLQRRSGSEVILLAEDEENIRLPAREMLAAQGYRVLAAGSGAEALDLLHRHEGTIHLLVTDVIMPGMSGSQLAEQMAAARPEMKVLYISGYPEDAIARHGVLEPGEFFLQKPFPPSQFLRTIREVLDSPPRGPSA
jgi:PAS domain S-box-containing protein